MSGYHEMIEKDIELLWSIQDLFRRTPWLDIGMSKIVSKYPLQDISMIVWCFFIIGVIEIGRPHFWNAAFNLLFAVVLRNLIEAKRPVEFDENFRPSTDLNSGSYGFPSLESYMSVVILGHLVISFKSFLLFTIALGVVFIVGISRLYSRSRFPHQIVGSWILGVGGLFFSIYFCEYLAFHKMTKLGHAVCLGSLALIVLGNLALAIENNESRLLFIPKKEFLTVLSGIISSSNETERKEIGSESIEPG
jgi:membrane-associated phospholipid phosphatase